MDEFTLEEVKEIWYKFGALVGRWMENPYDTANFKRELESFYYTYRPRFPDKWADDLVSRAVGDSATRNLAKSQLTGYWNAMDSGLENWIAFVQSHHDKEQQMAQREADAAEVELHDIYDKSMQKVNEIAELQEQVRPLVEDLIALRDGYEQIDDQQEQCAIYDNMNRLVLETQPQMKSLKEWMRK